MDIIEWLLNNGNILDATVIAHFIVLAVIIELFGIVTYWLPRIK